MPHRSLHAASGSQDNAADPVACDDIMSFEDLLLIGGILAAIAIFSGTHAHAHPVTPPAISAPAPGR